MPRLATIEAIESLCIDSGLGMKNLKFRRRKIEFTAVGRIEGEVIIYNRIDSRDSKSKEHYGVGVELFDAFETNGELFSIVGGGGTKKTPICRR